MEIPYGKIAIYALTFLGYIYSGYGTSFITNLRDAVLSAESIFGDVLGNFLYVAKKFKSLNEIVDAAVEENCVFKCPGNLTPRPNRNHVPKGDGCGSLGVKIHSDYLPIGEMTKCCDAHDICYDTCNNDKEVCDVEFRRCLYKYCDSYEKSIGGPSIVRTCKGAAKVLYTGTLTLGCKSYMDAQSKACYCPPTYGWKDKRNAKYQHGSDL